MVNVCIKFLPVSFKFWFQIVKLFTNWTLLCWIFRRIFLQCRIVSNRLTNFTISLNVANILFKYLYSLLRKQVFMYRDSLSRKQVFMYRKSLLRNQVFMYRDPCYEKVFMYRDPCYGNKCVCTETLVTETSVYVQRPLLR